MDHTVVLQTNISTFPDFTDVSIGIKPHFDELLRINPPQASEYTFTNIFIWRYLYKFKVCFLDSKICIMGIDRSGTEYFMIIAKDITAYIDAIRHLSSVYKHEGKTSRFFRVEGRFIEPLKQEFPSLSYEPDRDNSDYIYMSSDLIDLKGRRYDGKRNHIRRFKEKYLYEYKPITAGLIDGCIELTEIWYKTKENESLKPDVIATKEALTNYTALGLSGGTIIIDGKVRAFSITEQLNPQTAVIHIEKYDPSYEGISQMINQQLCSNVCGTYKYINREQDTGSEGLRKSKLSYNPVLILDKYKVSI